MMSITPLMPVYTRCDVRPVRGEHCHLIGEDGRRFLDFASGIAVNILGHSHAGLIGAIQHQAATLMHVSNLYGSPQGERLARRLVELTFADTVFFTNSGAEAVECAIKTVRAYHQHVGNDHKFEIITFNNAFHGRTLATISASSQEKMHKGFFPCSPGFKYVEFNDLDAVRAAIGPQTAGILIEPIQGEGGIRVGTEDFMQGLRALADEHDLLLALDEVQCGVARSGTFYAYEQYGIEPGRPGHGQGHRRRLPAGRMPGDGKGRARHGRGHARHRPMAATRWPWRPAKPCLMWWPMTNSSPKCATRVSGCAGGWSSSSAITPTCFWACAAAG
jgi:acetylornithine/N-succinyldiaminopimelate aminotransferase